MNELYNKIEEMFCSYKYTFGEIFRQMRELGYTDEDIDREFKEVCNKYVPPTNEYI